MEKLLINRVNVCPRIIHALSGNAAIGSPASMTALRIPKWKQYLTCMDTVWTLQFFPLRMPKKDSVMRIFYPDRRALDLRIFIENFRFIEVILSLHHCQQPRKDITKYVYLRTKFCFVFLLSEKNSCIPKFFEEIEIIRADINNDSSLNLILNLLTLSL